MPTFHFVERTEKKPVPHLQRIPFGVVVVGWMKMFSHCRWGCGYSVACGFLQMTLTACNVRCIFFSPSVSMHLCVCVCVLKCSIVIQLPRYFFIFILLLDGLLLSFWITASMKCLTIPLYHKFALKLVGLLKLNWKALICSPGACFPLYLLLFSSFSAKIWILLRYSSQIPRIITKPSNL